MSETETRKTPSTSMPIRCRCGTLSGNVTEASSGDGFRVVCYCDDCQAFARFLEKHSSERILDEHGGTDIYQLSPARLAITEGRERLACLRVTMKGPFRWYADCCKTPIGNTLATRQLPFLGLIRNCIALDEQSLESVIGPVDLRVMARHAKGDLSSLEVHDRFLLSQVAGVLGKIIKWRLKGDHKRSPFFDIATGEPVASFRLLSEETTAAS